MNLSNTATADIYIYEKEQKTKKKKNQSFYTVRADTSVYTSRGYWIRSTRDFQNSDDCIAGCINVRHWNAYAIWHKKQKKISPNNITETGDGGDKYEEHRRIAA